MAHGGFHARPDVASRAQQLAAISAARPQGMTMLEKLARGIPTVKVGEVNLGNILSDATGRQPVVQSEGGRQRSAKIAQAIPDASVGDVNLGNILSDATGRRPIGQSEGGKQRSAALVDAPGKIASGLTSGIGQVFDELGNLMPQAAGYAAYRPKPPAEIKKRIEEAILGPSLLPTDQEIASSLQDIPPIGPADMPLDPGFKKALERPPASTDPDEIFPDTPVVLSPPVVDEITQEGGKGTQDGDENIIPTTGQNLSDAAKDLLNRPSLSAEAVNKQVDKLLGIDSAVQEKTGKPATKKERIKAEVAILKEALGEDAAKDIRTSGAYNLMMTGLMIAAGDSPDAMTNIVKGLAGGLKTYGDATGEEAQRKNKLEQSLGLQAYSNVREEIAAEKIAAVKLKEQKASLAGQIYLNEANNKSAMERLVAKEGFDATRFQQTLKLQTDTLEQNLKIANMPPADIRTLVTLSQEPQLLETMEEAATAKDPYKLESSILGQLIKNPILAMELDTEGGLQKLQGFATTLADSFRKAREQDNPQAGADAKPPLTGDAAQAHIDANAAAKAAGQSTYTIGNQTFGVK